MKLFKVIEITLHGRSKWEIAYVEGGKHVAYLNDKGEAQTLVRLLNTPAYVKDKETKK